MRTLPGAALVLLIATRCASSSGQPDDTVSVITSPTGATAIAGDQRITTPGHFVVPPNAVELEIRIEMAGYVPVTVLVTRENDSSAYSRCLKAIGLEPPADKPPKSGGQTTPEGTGIAIGEAVSKAVEECSRKSTHLSKTHVFMKLEPLPGTLTTPRN
jgi:hypothetical protein